MDPNHSFDLPLAHLSVREQAALDAALQREGIERQWSGSTLRIDIAYEARVSSLVDQARGGVLPAPAEPEAPTQPQYPSYGQPTMTAAPVPNQPAYPQNYGYGQPVYPAYASYAPASVNNNLAIASLVCGIAGLVLCQLIGIPAVICGHRARAQIRDSNGTQTGDAMALIGLITGYISVGLVALSVIFVVIVIIASSV